jgi:predicted amidohydrolase
LCPHQRNKLVKADIAVILGTERVIHDVVLLAAMVINRDGTIAGFQDKVQPDQSEENIYSSGSERKVFRTDGVTFGVVICHEG